MKKVIMIGSLLAILGLAGTIVSIFLGFVDFDLIFIIPVISSSSPLGVSSLLLLVIGIFVLLSGIALGGFTFDGKGKNNIKEGKGERRTRSGRVRSEWGGVVFLGPIPIIFGKSPILRRVPYWIFVIFGCIVFLIIMLMFFLMRGLF